MQVVHKKDLLGYAFIRKVIVHTGAPPSLREIMRAIGYNSPRSVQLMLQRLHDRGLIIYQGGTIVLRHEKAPPGEHTLEVPLVGAVACGAPSLAEQSPEALVRISTRLARPGHT